MEVKRNLICDIETNKYFVPKELHFDESSDSGGSADDIHPEKNLVQIMQYFLVFLILFDFTFSCSKTSLTFNFLVLFF